MTSLKLLFFVFLYCVLIFLTILISFVLCTTEKQLYRCGVLSEVMVICASTPEKVEILDPPTGSVPGDRVIVEVYIYSTYICKYNCIGTTDTQLNPKKSRFNLNC